MLNSSSRTAVKATNRLLVTFRCAQALSAAPDVILSEAKDLARWVQRCFAALSMTLACNSGEHIIADSLDFRRCATIQMKNTI